MLLWRTAKGDSHLAQPLHLPLAVLVTTLPTLLPLLALKRRQSQVSVVCGLKATLNYGCDIIQERVQANPGQTRCR